MEQQSRETSGQKARLKEQFLEDPDVKQSLMKHINSIQRMEMVQEPQTAKYDRVGESTLYHPPLDEEAFREQSALATIVRRQPLFSPSFQPQVTFDHYHEEDELEDSVTLQSKLPSHKQSKQLEGKKEKKKPRKGLSADKKGHRHTGMKKGGLK